MKKSFWDKRIPTLLSIGIIGISMIITSFALRTQTSIVSRADVTQMPQNVKITNVSDKNLTVSYTTEVANIGSINFGVDKNLDQVALDQRDQETGLIRPHRIHSFTLNNLKPLTQYFFTIVSGDNEFLNNNVPYEATTAPRSNLTAKQEFVLEGKVILPNGETPEEALVYISTQKAQEVSVLAKSNGQYSLTPKTLLLKDLSSSITLDENDVIEITITDGKLKSKVLLLAKQTSSIPVVTLSNDYDFTLGTQTTILNSLDGGGFSSIVRATQIPTATPTVALAPTNTPIPTPTPTPSPIALSTPAPSPISLQETPLGNQSIFSAGLAGIAISLLGALLFITTRGGILKQ